ncbi:MAG: extracellular solute-binding protein, partial [Peptococcaceae bacterium]|nr:extracellular solute-binding protein [Peptococcaceae bacterium]
MFEKVCAVLLTIAMIFSFASCVKGAEEANHPATDSRIALPGELSGEITISYFEAIFYEKFINEAIYLFEYDHPGTKINVAPYSMMPEVATLEREGGYRSDVIEGWDEASIMDYVSRINTELISGEGPDIIAVDVLPYYKYAENGAFEDLLPYIEADESFDITSYQHAVLEGTRYKSGQYMIPLDFDFRFISFDKNRVDSASADALKEKGRFTYWELTDIIQDQFAADDSGARVINYVDGALRAFRYVFNGEYKNYVDLENKEAHFIESDFL